MTFTPRYIPEHHALIYDGEPVPGSVPLNDGLQVCKTDMKTLLPLIERGLEIPLEAAPILREYEYPSSLYRPMKHQYPTSAFLTLNKRNYNLSEIGTSKTLSTLWAYDYLRSQGILHRALVVAPLSTLHRVWDDEVFKHFSHLHASVLHGDASKRKMLLASRMFDVYIVNFDGLNIIWEDVRNRPDIDLIIIDELSTYRNPSTQLWKAANALFKDGTRWGWGLTGTPVPNKAMDAYGQVKLLTPHRVARTKRAFQDSVMYQVSKFKWNAKDNAIETLSKVMQPSIRYERSECLDLPPTTYSTRVSELSPDQKSLYHQMLKEFHVEYQEGKISASNESVKEQKLVQIACGVVYDNAHESITVHSVPRQNILLEVLEEAEAKVLVFAPFVAVVEHLTAFLREKGYTVGAVTEASGAAKRAELFRSFQQDPEPQILVANPKAMAHGLTLTAANVICWYAPIQDNEVYMQANGRITRSSQKRNTHIVHISASPVEDRRYKSLMEKTSFQGGLLDVLANLQV